MIICIGSEKGGTGKSMISSNLAVLRASQGRSVLLVDTDPQGSAAEFSRSRDENDEVPEIVCVQIQGKSVSPEIKKLRSRYDDIVVDVGGRYSEGFAGALRVCDKLIIPFLPSQSDVWALQNMEEIVAAARENNTDLRAYMVLNKADAYARSTMNDEAREFATTLQELELLPVAIGYRMAYRRAFGSGFAVTELQGRNQDKKATAEIEALAAEVWK